MKNGFWKDYESLKEEYPEATWDYLENEDKYCGYRASDFLHGCCDIFAKVLHDTYGYKLEYVESLGLVHAYCVGIKDGREYYIDIRGICDDYDAFMEEFKDSIIPYHHKKLRTDEVPEQYKDSSTDGQDYKNRMEAAKEMIAEYRYYNLYAA